MKNRLFPALAFGVALALTVASPLSAQETPQSSTGDSVARPKKPATSTDTDNPTPSTSTPPAPAPDSAPIHSEYNKPKNTPAADGTTFKSESVTVNVDVSVMDNHNQFIPNLKPDQFRILEDGVPQKISQANLSEAPITICMLIEFSGRFQQFWSQGWYETLMASYGFLGSLKPDDVVAVVAYDLRPTILSDFSPDKQKAEEAMSRLRIPGFSESNVFDALTDMADRMSAIEGRKAIILIGTGLDTFSKITFDQARKSLQESGVPIYTMSILQIARIGLESQPGMSAAIANMDFLQADNEMRTFSKETGGLSFFPRFTGEYPGDFRQIEQALREQYSFAYHPTNVARDGKFRRIKVELVNPETNETLRIVDKKNKPIKYTVIAKAGYKAPREVD